VLLGAGVLSVVALSSIVFGIFGALAWWLFCCFLLGFVRLEKLQMCHQKRWLYVSFKGLKLFNSASTFVSLSYFANINLLSIVLKHFPFTNLKFVSIKSSIFSF
jgi:hypothetical protein